MGSIPTWSQVNNDTNKGRVYMELVDSMLLDFIKEKGIAIAPDLPLLGDLSTLLPTIPSDSISSNNVLQLPPMKAGVLIDNYYRVGDSTLILGEEGWFTNIGLNTNIQIAGLPIQANASTVLKDGHLQRGFSTASISFDAQAYKQQLIEKYLPKKTPQQLLEDVKGTLSLSEYETLQTEVVYEFYRKVVTHPEFIALKRQVLSELDSLRQPIDSTVQVFQDTLQTGVDSVASQLKKIEEKYNYYWELKQKAAAYTDIKAIRKKVTTLKEQWLKDLDPREQLKQVLQNQALSQKEKLLAMTNGLDVGQFVLDQSDLTINQMSVAGIRYRYQKDKYFGEVAFGKQYQKAIYNPLFAIPTINPLSGRNFWLINGGIETTSQGLSLTALYTNEQNQPDSILTFPKHNVVLAAEAFQEIKTGWQLEASVAISEYSIGQNNLFTEGNHTQQSDKIATELLIVKEGATSSLGLGYFYTGHQFLTLGNPFLLVGRQGLSTRLETGWWEDRVTLSVEGKYGWALHTTEGLGNFTEWQMKGELSAKIGETGTISGQFIPNTFYQKGADESIETSSNIFAIQGFFVHSLSNNNRLVSGLSITNLRTDYTLGDSLRNDGRLYLYGRESLNIANGKNLNLTYRIGGKNIVAIDDYLLQLDGDFSIKKLRLKTGGQFLQTPFLDHWQWGLIQQLSMPLSRFGALDGRVNYQKVIGQSGHQFIGNLSLRINLSTAK